MFEILTSKEFKNILVSSTAIIVLIGLNKFLKEKSMFNKLKAQVQEAVKNQLTVASPTSNQNPTSSANSEVHLLFIF
jgi:hypothetical protein